MTEPSKEKDGFSPKNPQESKENTILSSNTFTTKPKKGKRKPNKQSLEKVHLLTEDNETKSLVKTAYSNTKVHFFDFIKQRWKSDKRVPVSIRMNSELYKAFKPYSKAKYGSVCRPLEAWMAVELLTDSEKVHFSNTEKPISIGQIVIERNLRPRRNLEIQESDVEKSNCCQINGCSNVAADKGVYLESGKEYRLCKFHFENNCLNNPKAWKVSK